MKQYKKDCQKQCEVDFNDGIRDCPCNEGCLTGCPCPVYECPVPRNAILILSTIESASIPVITDVNGRVDTEFQFKIDDDIYVHDSCGLRFRGEFYLYGSLEADHAEIAKLDGCSLKKIGTLPFTFQRGGCANRQNEFYLCFDTYGDHRTCYVSNEPTGPFTTVSKSTYQHTAVRVALNDSMSIYSLTIH